MENELSAVRKLVRVKSYKNASKMMWVAEAGHIFYLFNIALPTVLLSGVFKFFILIFCKRNIYFVLSQTHECQRTTVFK